MYDSQVHISKAEKKRILMTSQKSNRSLALLGYWQIAYAHPSTGTTSSSINHKGDSYKMYMEVSGAICKHHFCCYSHVQ